MLAIAGCLAIRGTVGGKEISGFNKVSTNSHERFCK